MFEVRLCRGRKEGTRKVDDDFMKGFDTLIQGLSPSNDPPQVSIPNLKLMMIYEVKVYGLSGFSSYDHMMI